MKYAAIAVLLVLVAGASACFGANDDAQDGSVSPVERTLPTSTPSPGPTATLTPAPMNTPTAEPTATPPATPTSTPIAEPTAASLPTPATEGGPAGAGAFPDSLAFEADIDLIDLLTESEWPVKAHFTGWVSIGNSQIFFQVDMSEPVDRSFEILMSSSFDIHLRDVEEDRWYFIPENSDTGPLRDVVPWAMLFVGFAGGAGHELEGLAPVDEGYVMEIETELGSSKAVLDKEYMLRELVMEDSEGHEFLRATVFGYGEEYLATTPERGEPLPEDYWE